MSLLPPSLTRLIENFQRLPGVGPKTAQRLAFYLLHVPEEELEKFADNLTNLKKVPCFARFAAMSQKKIHVKFVKMYQGIRVSFVSLSNRPMCCL